MDIIQDLAVLAVQAAGLGMAVMGLISFSEGKSQHNAGAQSEGMTKMIGGAVIFMAGGMVIPQIFSMLSI